MAGYSVVPARLTHIGPLASNMRAIDRVECEALGRSPKEALRTGLRCSLSAFTGLEGSSPLCMFGVVPDGLLGGSGRVWFLGATGIERHGRALLSFGPQIIGEWLETFTRLHNVVAAQNVYAIRLLRRWGFEVANEPRELGGVTFLPFSMERGAIQGQALAA